MRIKFIFVAAFFCAAASSQAHAFSLNVFGGSYMHADEHGLAAIELTEPIIVDVGPFFEWSRTTVSGSENRYLAGLVGRFTLPVLAFFGDARLGYDWSSLSSQLPDRDGFQLEFGFGYRFGGDTIGILPRVGVVAARPNSQIPRTNLSLGVAISL
jgi:hypothetical protein